MTLPFAACITRRGKASTTSIVVVAIAGLLVVVVCIVAAAVYMQLKAVDSRRLTANNMKQIGLALHNYHDTFGSFPPQYFADESGVPIHSWRVMLLPFLEQTALYDQYNFDEPWDGPNNSLLMSQMPRVFRDPTVPGSPRGATTYQAIADTGAILSGAIALKFSDITDGTSNTAVVVENTGVLVPWLSPEDTQLDALIQGIPFEAGEVGGTNILMADGSVHFIREDTPAKTLRALSTRNEGEVLPRF